MDHRESKGIPEKTSTSCFIDYAKDFDCGYQETESHETATLWQFLKTWEYQSILPASWQTCMQVKKQQLEQYVEQRTSSKLEKEYIKDVYCHPEY